MRHYKAQQFLSDTRFKISRILIRPTAQRTFSRTMQKDILHKRLTHVHSILNDSRLRGKFSPLQKEKKFEKTLIVLSTGCLWIKLLQLIESNPQINNICTCFSSVLNDTSFILLLLYMNELIIYIIAGPQDRGFLTTPPYAHIQKMQRFSGLWLNPTTTCSAYLELVRHVKGLREES